MTTKTTTAILIGLTLIAIAPTTRAEIASKAYVDERNNTLIFGTTEPDSGMVQSVEQNGGIVGGVTYLEQKAQEMEVALENKVDTQQGLASATLVTGADGKVSLATGGYIRNNDISHFANIELGKLAMPLPGNDCETNGCMLMYYNGKYVWELITRDTNEGIETSGSVNATARENPKIITLVNETCSSNSDCPAGWRCQRGVCAEAPMTEEI